MDKKKENGFSLVEVLLAVAIFSLSITPLVISVIYGQESAALSGMRARASYLASEGIEAARNMRDEDFLNLLDNPHGLAVVDGEWTLSGTSDVTDFLFTRQVVISSLDDNTKKVDVSVSWPQNLQRDGLVSLSTYLTNWRAPIPKGGMVAYGDGGTSTDEIKYKSLDIVNGWSDAFSAADIDPNSSNKYLRSIKLYSSLARDEKILISRHFDGTSQFIYAQVFDGNSWNDVNALANWTGSDYLDVQNFSGTYLANGDFLAVYSDNTSVPKMKRWNGGSWSSASSLTNLGSGQIPVYIVLENRSGSNEAMAAFFTQASDTLTQYYSGSSWSSITTHATAAPVNTKRFIDFQWSEDLATSGALIYASGRNAKSISGRLWVANGSGGGSWGLATSSSNQANNIGALALAARRGANEFAACDKDDSSASSIRCYKMTFSGNRIYFSNPQNQTLTSSTSSTIQRSFDIGFDYSGNVGVGVYSDGTSTAKFKSYDPSLSLWDPNANEIASPGYTPGNFQTITLIPNPDGVDDVMILMADNNQDVYSAVWKSSDRTIYQTPPGKAFSRHGTSGSHDTDFWFDFAWDRY